MELDATMITEVLRDVVEGQCQTQKVIENLEKKLIEKDRLIAAQLVQQQQLIAGFEEKFATIRVKAPLPDLSPVSSRLERGLQEIHAAVQKKRAPVRLLFFPEQNPEKFYRIVAGYIVPWTFGFIVVIFLCVLGDKSLDAYHARQYNRQGNACIAAWNQIYRDGGKKLKRNMSDALIKAQEAN